MPIRIMHVVDNLGRGGMQNGLVNLIARLDPERFEHSVCTMRRLEHNEAHRFPDYRVQVTCVDEGKGSRIQIASLARKIREAKPDIVHSRNWSAVEAVLAGYWAGSCKLVHSEHGFDSNTNNREPWRRRSFRRLAFELAHRVFCVSFQLRDLHAKRTGFAARRMDVIHNGVDTRIFRPDAAERDRVRRELGIPANEFCIGSVGNLTPVKDYPTLLAALLELARVRQDWRMLVVGEGAELPRLEAFVREHAQLQQRVSFLGLSNRVPALLNAMDVYVVSSVIEGICNSLLEAMATGLPVMATATGGNPEVAADGDSGLLFPVGDSKKLATHLLTVMSQRDLRQELGQRAISRAAEQFSIDSMVRRYEQLYEGLGQTLAATPAGAVVGV